MSVDHIRYDLLAQDALRGIVRRVLTDAATKGLPGEHHFFIAFATRAPGVRISDRLLAQHPEEMTIVLQHQFWDLIVTDQAFEVGLSFNGITERLHVPYAAIKGFTDPSVQFGLQFDTNIEQGSSDAEPAATKGARPKPLAVSDTVREIPAATEPATAQSKPVGDDADGGKDPPSGGAEVVRLDRFRKK